MATKTNTNESHPIPPLFKSQAKVAFLSLDVANRRIIYEE